MGFGFEFFKSVLIKMPKDPPDLFGDEVGKTCVALCSDSYFVDPSTRLCV